ncbi:MAG: flagellar type III secretion system pore protein FliP [Dactylosporangium sp.]|nr:flagellar type III secretion system pore protein FliP [Dactylosporangium sp.]NNJ61282.1 flagellar type III secretion system pore protein FliP [Dactylosporangium sp.]
MTPGPDDAGQPKPSLTSLGLLLASLGFLLAGVGLAVTLWPASASASASVLTAPRAPTPSPPTAPTAPVVPGAETDGAGDVTIDIGGKPSTSITILVTLTVLSVAPAILLLCTSFTKIFVVLSITRNALGMTTVPPNQVIAGLALFLSLFIMSPTLSAVNDQGVQPYLRGDKTQSVAFDDGVAPLKTFMVTHTRDDEIALFTKISDRPKPKNKASVPLTTLIPAFALSELRTAFLIGFIVYVPFLVIDMVISAALMSMGMMMLPPVTVSLPFKLLLFVLVDGWGLVVTALVASYR